MGSKMSFNLPPYFTPQYQDDDTVSWFIKNFAISAQISNELSSVNFFDSLTHQYRTSESIVTATFRQSSLHKIAIACEEFYKNKEEENIRNNNASVKLAYEKYQLLLQLSKEQPK